MTCIICGAHGEKHHFKSRGSGGTDDEWNIMYLCRKHHTEFHRIGATTFVNKYAQVRNWMIYNKWEFNEFKNKWMRYEYRSRDSDIS